MHQPVYRIRKDGKNVYIMPWVYMHGIREYYDVARVIEDIDNIKLTINFVPSLIEQLNDYINNDFEDVFLQHFKKDAESLSFEERVFILKNFFSLNYNTKLKNSKRYLYLLDKRGSPYDIEKKVSRFTTSEIRDLQILFYLYNTSVYATKEFPELGELKRKDYGYSEEDKTMVLEVHKTLLSRIVPLYRKLQEEGKIEITFTPYAHPISPLLIDSSCAEVSNPYTRLPETRWRFPKNAERQLLLGMDYIESVFKKRPSGMWPAEGGVSEKFINLARVHDVKWVGTDEGILEKSLGYVIRNGDFPSEIYKIYEFNGVRILFRDRELSDSIGFDLYRLSKEKAISYFMDRIRNIVVHGGEVISIILDGENPWENYKDGGVPFLKKLFSTLEASGMVEFVTGEDLLNHESKKLVRLHPGSWIRSDFTTWIGHPEKNKAWEYLIRVKNEVKDSLKEQSHAEMELMYAEGSDWFWWYGDDNPTFYAETFDVLFREHLKEIYRKLGRNVPGFLDVPVRVTRKRTYVIEEDINFISPTLDGKVTNFFEWLGAGVIDLESGQGGVMQRGKSSLTRLFFGRDENNLYLRVEGEKSLESMEGIIGIEFFDIEGHKIFEIVEGKYGDCVKGKVFECSVQLGKVMLDDTTVALAIKIIVKEIVQERFPASGFYILRLISREDVEKNWIV